jgi:pSer/pThr/pTyr-binding forkhead associated (FHA) protein
MIKKNNKKNKDKIEKNKNEKKINEKKEKEDNNQKNKNNRICRICYGDDTTDENPLICPCICKGSMKYIHYECLKNWLNSKIEEDISIDSENSEIEVISYNRKDISCELCKEKLPDYVKHNDRYYNISFYKPKFEEFVVMESMRADKHKAKFIHIISFDKKTSINIGRANECELSISELSVSRFHCIIHKDEGDLFLEDNSSKFGTLILIQNNKMFMNDYIPLKVQTNKTYIKFKIVKPFKLSCCRDPFIYESKKYDYQIQNRKCFDILSYFIIKEDDPNQTEKEEEEENKNNINEKENELIDDDDKIENEEKKEDNNKELINDDTKKENKSEIDYEHLDSKTHSHRIKKVNIKKGKNESNELPNLDKINIEHFRDSISLIADKDGKLPGANNNGQQSKQISLIKLNKKEGNYDKTNANPSMGGNNTNPVHSIGVVKDYSNKNK